MSIKAVVYLKHAFEMTGGAYNVIYGTPHFDVPVPGGGDNFCTMGTIGGGINISIPRENIAAFIWEDAEGNLDTALSTYITNSTMLGYVACT